MDDLISRQAAIRELRIAIMHYNDMYFGEQLVDGYNYGINKAIEELEKLPSAQLDITDEQAIEHLQASGWMQSHDKQMYEMGLKERLADDSESYDALLPAAQPEQRGLSGWICPVCGRGLSPFTSVCPCNNGKGWEITC